jgi:YD repeat-containing protein
MQRAAVGALVLAIASSATAGTTTYTYDALGRLLTAIDGNGRRVAYAYDPAGNRILVSGGVLVTAVDDQVGTSPTSPVTFDPRINDVSSNGSVLTITATGNPAHGSAVINSNGTAITYTPNSSFSSSDQFGYTVRDTANLSASATIFVSANAVGNRPPSAAHDDINTAKNTSVTFDPRANDTDPDGDALVILSVTAPPERVTNNGTSLTYAPGLDFVGADTFFYTVRDPAGLSASNSITVNVQASNTAPIARPDTDTVSVYRTVIINPLWNDIDPDGDPITIVAVSNGSAGTTVINGGSTISYTSTSGTPGTDSFGYTISDNKGLTHSSTVGITITANGNPVVQNDFLETTTGSNFVIYPLQNDSDPDGDPITLTSISPQPAGIATQQGNAINFTAPTYTGTVAIYYTISDGRGGTSGGHVQINVICAAGGNCPIEP